MKTRYKNYGNTWTDRNRKLDLLVEYVQIDGHGRIWRHCQDVGYGQGRQYEVHRRVHVLPGQDDDVQDVGDDAKDTNHQGEVAMHAL